MGYAARLNPRTNRDVRAGTAVKDLAERIVSPEHLEEVLRAARPKLRAQLLGALAPYLSFPVESVQRG